MGRLQLLSMSMSQHKKNIWFLQCNRNAQLGGIEVVCFSPQAIFIYRYQCLTILRTNVHVHTHVFFITVSSLSIPLNCALMLHSKNHIFFSCWLINMFKKVSSPSRLTRLYTSVPTRCKLSESTDRQTHSFPVKVLSFHSALTRCQHLIILLTHAWANMHIRNFRVSVYSLPDHLTTHFLYSKTHNFVSCCLINMLNNCNLPIYADMPQYLFIMNESPHDHNIENDSNRWYRHVVNLPPISAHSWY